MRFYALRTQACVIAITSCRFAGRVVCAGIWSSSPNKSAITAGLVRPKTSDKWLNGEP